LFGESGDDRDVLSQLLGKTVALSQVLDRIERDPNGAVVILSDQEFQR
jgi:hypothetical protein